MSTLTNLQWFDRLARWAIDPILETVTNENNSNPDYLVKLTPDSSPFRRCGVLTIQNRDPRQDGRAGSLAFTEAGNAVRVKQSCRRIDNGKPLLVATLDSADVTEAEIGRLTREFVGDFFRRVTQAPT
jgi:hypothetical protein